MPKQDWEAVVEQAPIASRVSYQIRDKVGPYKYRKKLSCNLQPEKTCVAQAKDAIVSC